MLFQITLPGLFGLLLQQVQLFALLLQRPFNLLHKAEGGVQGTGTDHALPRRGDTLLILVVIADQLLALLLFRLQLLRSEEHTSELQSRENLVCRLLLEKTKQAPTSE